MMDEGGRTKDDEWRMNEGDDIGGADARMNSRSVPTLASSHVSIISAHISVPLRLLYLALILMWSDCHCTALWLRLSLTRSLNLTRR